MASLDSCSTTKAFPTKMGHAKPTPPPPPLPVAPYSTTAWMHVVGKEFDHSSPPVGTSLTQRYDGCDGSGTLAFSGIQLPQLQHQPHSPTLPDPPRPTEVTLPDDNAAPGAASPCTSAAGTRPHSSRLGLVVDSLQTAGYFTISSDGAITSGATDSAVEATVWADSVVERLESLDCALLIFSSLIIHAVAAVDGALAPTSIAYSSAVTSSPAELGRSILPALSTAGARPTAALIGSSHEQAALLPLPQLSHNPAKGASALRRHPLLSVRAAPFAAPPPPRQVLPADLGLSSVS